MRLPKPIFYNYNYYSFFVLPINYKIKFPYYYYTLLEQTIVYQNKILGQNYYHTSIIK